MFDFIEESFDMISVSIQEGTEAGTLTLFGVGLMSAHAPRLSHELIKGVAEYVKTWSQVPGRTFMSTARRYELSDFEWSILQPLLPNKPRGVPRAEDRKLLNGLYWRLRTGSPWADIPERYGPATTCANRFRRGAKIGVWDRVFDAISEAYDGDLQMVDSSSVRVHPQGGNVKKGVRTPRLPPLGTTLEPSAWGDRAAG